MTTFRVTINCDGADITGPNPPGPDGHALARVLIDLGHNLAAGHMPSTLLDLNGNSVGTVELTDAGPPDMERVRGLVSEFADDLSTGSGIGDTTLVDSATLRQLYNLVFGLSDEEEEEEEEDEESEYPDYPCPDDSDGQHHAGCGCDF